MLLLAYWQQTDPIRCILRNKTADLFGETMDRRQRKTRTAIFRAFTALLARKPFHRITVEEILTEADVGRATFYAHFETRDSLLQALCEELFRHIFDAMERPEAPPASLFQCQAPDSAFAHLFAHLERNDNQILQLLTGQNSTLFLPYFKEGLCKLASRSLSQFPPSQLPEDYRTEIIAATFVQTLDWWLRQPQRLPAETVTAYFMLAVA